MATRNVGKLREFRTLLARTGWSILGLADIAIDRNHEETGRSFAENARGKALNYSRDTGLPVLADDSGLEIATLEGRPGIYSARYGGSQASDADRIRKILEELEAAGGSRDARFVCALALALSGSVLAEAEGECIGEIAREPRGADGFGYDPIFLVPELGKTMAELSEEEKNRHSHRGRAVTMLVDSPRK